MSKYFLFFLIIACFSCSNENKTLDEAYEIHKSIRQSQREVMMQLATLEAFSEKENEVRQLKSDYIEWKNDILEVPGYPHIHLEGDDHSHNPQPDFPDEQILEIQKESRKKIDEIAARIKSLKEEGSR
jgi:hypothetical protein